MRIGVLALQGAFAEHIKMLKKIGVETLELRQERDVRSNFDGLIIPGGESTVMGKLLRELNMLIPLQERILTGLPVFGTCAGLIVLAKEIADSKATHLATMDITAERNAYGRQLGSFKTEGEFKGIGTVLMTFIRAPYICAYGKDVDILSVVGGRVVAARQKNQLVTAFHPELDDDASIHRYFIDIVGKQ